MGFLTCKAEPDIWMRQSNGLWEYIAVYVDNLTFFVREPKTIITLLEENYKYKLKGIGIISYSLGCDFFRDDQGILRMAPKKFIEKTISGFKHLFNKKLSIKYKSPLERGIILR